LRPRPPGVIELSTSTLKKARTHIARGKYDQAIRLLQSEIYLHRDDEDFFYLLGLAHLYVNDAGGAETFFNRCLELNPLNRSAKLGLGFALLRKRRINSAIEKFLAVLEVDPQNRIAHKALRLIRLNSETELAALFQNPGFSRHYPRVKSGFDGMNPKLIALVFLVPLLAVGAFWLLNSQNNRSTNQDRRPGIPEIEITAGTPWVSIQGEFQILLTEQQLEESLRSAQNYLLEYRDNWARREVNRILLSNASEEVRNQALRLGRYQRQPDFTNFTDNPQYAEIRNFPPLYEGVYVRWRGSIANLRISDEIRFDFLVGYHTRQVTEGIVPVVVPFATNVQNGSALEIIAEVMLQDSDWYLRVSSLRPLLDGDNP